MLPNFYNFPPALFEKSFIPSVTLNVFLYFWKPILLSALRLYIAEPAFVPETSMKKYRSLIFWNYSIGVSFNFRMHPVLYLQAFQKAVDRLLR